MRRKYVVEGHPKARRRVNRVALAKRVILALSRGGYSMLVIGNRVEILSSHRYGVSSQLEARVMRYQPEIVAMLSSPQCRRRLPKGVLDYVKFMKSRRLS